MSEAPTARQLRAIAPRFLVAHIAPAAAYYRDVLGFTVERLWGEPPCFGMPHRDGMTVMLGEAADPSLIRPNGADGKTWDAYVWVQDADALFAELSARGARIVHPPLYREEYGNREFAVSDLDGYIIAFGQHLAASQKTGA
jgi:catechol 2,3-dioxygenase-like lactoylglutathione lyase family enzyme